MAYSKASFLLNNTVSLHAPLFSYYSKYVLNEPDSIEDGIGAPDWRLTLGLLFSWATIFLVIVRGVKSSGKAAYFLALFPYVIMITLLIRGATLPGAGEGILFFIEPQWKELLNPQVSTCLLTYLHTYSLHGTGYYLKS
jgi:solute carrier family 6 amino acid transporter-like protein 5/7/9/14